MSERPIPAEDLRETKVTYEEYRRQVRQPVVDALRKAEEAIEKIDQVLRERQGRTSPSEAGLSGERGDAP